jgi:hypothetical protein
VLRVTTISLSNVITRVDMDANSSGLLTLSALEEFRNPSNQSHNEKKKLLSPGSENKK